MATLNIKNFPDDLYRRLRELAEQERRSVSQQVIHFLDDAVREPVAHSIRELRGLGKEAWEHVEATVLVDEERGSWD